MLKDIQEKYRFNKKLLKSFLKGFFVFGMFSLLLFGFGPLKFLQKYIGAFGGEMRVISFYSLSSLPETASEDYSLGWWGEDKILDKPSISPNGSFSSFSDENSSFYNGGEYSLLVSNFFSKSISLPTKIDPFVEVISDQIIETEQSSSSTEVSSSSLISKFILTKEVNAQEKSSLSALGKIDSAKIMISMALSSFGQVAETDVNPNIASSSASSSLDNIIDAKLLENNNNKNILQEQKDLTEAKTAVEIISDYGNTLEEQQNVEIIEDAYDGRVDVEIENEAEQVFSPEILPQIEEETKEESINESRPSSDSGDDLISKLFSIKNVFAQENNAKFNIWYSISLESNDASSSSEATHEDDWNLLETVYDKELSNYLNDGFFSFDAPFIENWGNIENLKIKIEGLSTGESDFVLYIDSVWVDVSYEKDPSAPELPEEKELRWDNMLELLSNQKVFSFKEEAKFLFKYNKNKKSLIDGIGESLGFSTYWKDVDIEMQIENLKGEVLNLPLVIVFEDDGEFSVTLPEIPRGLKPGDYKIKFLINDNSGAVNEEFILTESFSWGVLAINTDKSVYTKKDSSSFIQMAVLDENGHTICDADLILEVKSPSGEIRTLDTSNETIIRNEFCGPDNVIDSPDYYTNFQLTEVGLYSIHLKAETQNGSKEIEDSFSVVDYVDFDIKRKGPTRIYPIANYEMNLYFSANQFFDGVIREFVPEDFYITRQSVFIKKASSSDFVLYNDNIATSSTKSEFREFIINGEKELTWSNINLESGDELWVVYEFDAPNISPELYLLGPASISTTTESRKWQIASDAISTYAGNNGINVGWTTATNAWNSINNNYASRIIPRKSVNDSANYLLLTSNTATDIGGDITKVEIAIEGYVQNTAVTAYVIPVLGGSDGATYTITGATMGTTDNDVPDYIDVTAELGTWTWSDIIGMDVRIYGLNSSNSADYNLYIDQINIRVEYTTNNLPTGTFSAAIQKMDSSGVVDISIQVDDLDDDDLRAKIDYVAGASCNFTTPLDPNLDETDGNATSTFGDAKIDNNLVYQIGSSTGWITTNQGANNVSFDWATLPVLAGQEGTYCLRLTTNDFVGDQSLSATTTVNIDNKNPTAPGALSFNNHRKDSLTLSFGATTTESNFSEYKIFWKLYDGLAPTESDNEVNYLDDANLSDLNFNGAGTTTIFGLIENTRYSISIWAYDNYGHKASSSFVSFYTNQAPTSIFNSATQRNNGSGIVDIFLNVDDGDNDSSVARVDYVAGESCDFSLPQDPTLDETQGNISSTYGVPTIDNDRSYQVGETGWDILTPDVNTISFDWLGQTDLPNGDGTYCLRFTMNDGQDEQNFPATTTLTIDNAAPSAPGQLTSGEVTGSTIKLIFGSSSSDSNFSRYKIFYKQGTSGVSEANTEHVDADLLNVNFNNTGSTTVSGLNLDTDYVFNIWAYDSFGNKISATEISAKTNASITNDSLQFVNPSSANYIIADGFSEWNFEASVSDIGGYNQLNTVVLRLADASDNSSPFTDLQFSWAEATGIFSETGVDAMNAVTISPNSTSTCSINNCVVNFRLFVNHKFTSQNTDYSAELYSTNDSAAFDNDVYTNIYQVKLKRIEQMHYRWRNDDGGE